MVFGLVAPSTHTTDVDNETKSDFEFSTLGNFGTTLPRCCVNVASTLVKATSKPVGLVASTDL